jgi:hypothetical protein
MNAHGQTLWTNKSRPALISAGEVGDIQGRLTRAFFVIRPAANPQFAFQAIVQFAAGFAESRFRGQALVAMVGELPHAVFDALKLEGAILDDYHGGVLGDACLPTSFATIDEFNLGRWIIIPLRQWNDAIRFTRYTSSFALVACPEDA